jgi:hypothetical protein
VLLAVRDEGRGRAPQRELATGPVGARDDDAATAIAHADDRHRLLLAAEVPHARGRPDDRRSARRPHRGAASPRGGPRTAARRSGAHLDIAP